MQSETSQVPGQLSYTHRSFSQVKQLRTCGYQFKLERLDRVPQRPGAANVAGDAVHVATEFIDKTLHTNDPGLERNLIVAEALDIAHETMAESLAKNAEKGWEEADHKAFGFKPKQDVEWYRTKGIPNCINSYVDWRLATRWPLADVPGFGPAIEVPFSYYVDDQQIIGAIDRVFVPDCRYCPVDLKSGRVPATNEQLALYGAVLRNVLGWPCEYGYYLHGLKNGRKDWNAAKPERGEARLTPPIRIDHWTDDQLASVYLGASRLIELGIYIPSPGPACELCAVSEHCPYAQAVV